MKSLSRRISHSMPLFVGATLAVMLGGCASAPKSGYGLSTGNANVPMNDVARKASAADDGVALTQANTRSTYLDLVQQMQQKGLWFASLAHIDALEKQWGVAPESTLMRAEALRQTDQAQPAAVLYTGLLSTPAAAAGHRGLGLIAAGSARYPEAITHFEKAQRLNPTDAALLSDLGYALLKAGRLAQARVPVMQAAQLQAENPRVVANLALYLLADGQAAGAEALMRERQVPPALRAAILQEAAQLASRGEGAAPAEATLQLKPAAWAVSQSQNRSNTP